MLAVRIIPTILSKRGQLVKGQKFAADRVVGHVLQAAKIHAMRGVDELMILDVTATKDGRDPDYEMVKALSNNCFSPITYGGGVNDSTHIRELLKSGADKVCLGTIANQREPWLWDGTSFLKFVSSQYGRSTIVVSVDVSDATKHDAINQAQYMEAEGAGEILLQNVTRDGTMEGYDLDLIHEVSQAVGIPVIASGGCKDYEDMYNAIQAGASAVAAGALFQFTSATPKGAAEYLHNKGVEVRL